MTPLVLALLITAMFAHLVWVVLLYAVLTILRAPNVWGIGAFAKWLPLEPRVSANLSNQFEWPLFFYIACLLVVFMGLPSSAYPWLAWVFVIGRMVHSLVQIFTQNIRLRGLVFTINFLAVFAMWLLLLAQVFSGLA